LHLLYDCGEYRDNLNAKTENDYLSLTEKLINSSSSILYDSKNEFNNSFLDYNPASKTKIIFREVVNKGLKHDEKSYRPHQKTKESLDNKTNININKEKENKKMQKPNPIKSEDFYNLKPIDKNSTINPITITKQTLAKNRDFLNPQNKGKIENKNEMNKKSRKILDEINSEYDVINKNLNSNIYNPNKENFNKNNIETEDFYNDSEAAYQNSFISENQNSVINKNAEENHLKMNKAHNPKKKSKHNLNPRNGDYSDYHLLQNYQEDIAYDDLEIMRILEKSKYEK